MSLPQCETQRVIPSGQNNEHQMFARRFSTASYRRTAHRANRLTAERDQILRSAVDDLDEAERAVVVLKTFAGLTFAAIGEVLEQSEKTVATRYRRALLKLEEKLRGQL